MSKNKFITPKTNDVTQYCKHPHYNIHKFKQNKMLQRQESMKKNLEIQVCSICSDRGTQKLFTYCQCTCAHEMCFQLQVSKQIKYSEIMNQIPISFKNMVQSSRSTFTCQECHQKIYFELENSFKIKDFRSIIQDLKSYIYRPSFLIPWPVHLIVLFIVYIFIILSIPFIISVIQQGINEDKPLLFIIFTAFLTKIIYELLLSFLQIILTINCEPANIQIIKENEIIRVHENKYQ